MSRRAIFRVTGRLDSAGSAGTGTVTIDRDAGLFTVRPRSARSAARLYTLPLSTVADLVVLRLVQAARREKLAAKAARRRK